MGEISDQSLDVFTGVSSLIVLANALAMLFVYFVGRTLWVGRRAFSVVVQRYERVFVCAFCVFSVIAEAAITHGWRLLDGAGACKPPSAWLFSWIMINLLSVMALVLALFSRRYMRYFLHLPVLLQTPGWLLYITSTSSSGGECGVAIIALFPLCAGAFLAFFVPQAFLINFDKVEDILNRQGPAGMALRHGNVEMTHIPSSYREEGRVPTAGPRADISYFADNATSSDVDRMLNPVSLAQGLHQGGSYLAAPSTSSSEDGEDAKLRRRKHDDSEYETRKFHRALNPEEQKRAVEKRAKIWGKRGYVSDSRKGTELSSRESAETHVSDSTSGSE